MRQAATLVLVLSSFACSEATPDPGDSASRSTKQRAARPAPAKLAPPPEPPAYLLLPWDTKLSTAPEQYAPALTLVGPSDAEVARQERGRVIQVVGKADRDGRWWKLQTIASPQLDAAFGGAIPGATIEGLGVYTLSLYVPAGTGEPLNPPGNVAINSGVLAALGGFEAVTQNGEPRPPGLDKEWVIDSGAKVFWPDGKMAGTVRQTHAFVHAGEIRDLDGRQLDCFSIRVGPPLKSPTKLCFEPNVVREVIPTMPMNTAELFASDAEVLEQFGVLGVMSDSEMQEGAGLGSLFDAVEEAPGETTGL